MTTPSAPHVPLSDGRSIPQIGLGVYKIPDGDAAECVRVALDAGYRHVDTAALYGNERGVGEGIRTSGIPRDDVFVTTKVWNDDHGFDETLRAFDASLDRLGLDEVDLYLVHWPIPSRDRYVETYRALERIRSEGRARSIGVSNFAVEHLERLRTETEVAPVVNQVELHPLLPQRELRAYHRDHAVVTEAWSPLARGRLLDDPALAILAAKHRVAPAQVVIRWHLQQGTVVIPKSVTPSRIRANIDVFGFALDDEDLAAIAALASGLRTGRDPSFD
ncbi:aldo/keto reductase [Microbacterium oryzae]|uniref:aldo/keto reductase n=1 Tax=Microbacterium oryzae TaxID=743009 RepID=UPI0025B0BD47|nr:aldo/keto reductase [Microbacterium oryzae]MDN3310775.1 aldo/keto reductase [Microbacterium oryzae]